MHQITHMPATCKALHYFGKTLNEIIKLIKLSV